MPSFGNSVMRMSAEKREAYQRCKERIFALCEGEESARKVGAAVSEVFSKIDLGNQLYVSRINREGVKMIES